MPAESDYLAGEKKKLYEAAKNTSTTALWTAPRRSEYLSCFFAPSPFQGSTAGWWSMVEIVMFHM